MRVHNARGGIGHAEVSAAARPLLGVLWDCYLGLPSARDDLLLGFDPPNFSDSFNNSLNNAAAFVVCKKPL
jgi:hypothetical protein